MRRRQVLFVDAVPAFVQDAEERLVEVLRVVARGEGAITGAGARAKRVGRNVEPAGLEVEADDLRRFAPESLLFSDREFAVQDLALRALGRSQQLGDERGQVLGERGEELLDRFGR